MVGTSAPPLPPSSRSHRTPPAHPPHRPTVSPGDQRDILNLLERLVAPIGEYRTSLPVSRGKKRKRAVPGATSDVTTEPLEKPRILNQITVGVNATTAALSVYTAVFTPPTLQLKTAGKEGAKTEAKKAEEKKEGESEEKEDKAEKGRTEPPAPCPIAVFVCAEQPAQLHSHLPVLCALAGKVTSKPVKLVSLSKGAEGRLADALGLPHVGVLGLRDGAEGTEGLLELVGKVGECKVEWLDTAVGYRESRIKTVMAGTGKRDTKTGGKADGQGAGKGAEKGGKAKGIGKGETKGKWKQDGAVDKTPKKQKGNKA